MSLAKTLQAQIEDIDELNLISFTSKQHWGYPEEWMELWKEDLLLTETDFEIQQIYKLVLEGKIIGFCAIQELTEAYDVTNLWIEPAHIGLGFGKMLLSFCIEKAVKNDKPIIVEADPNTEAFYANQGFVTYGQKESLPKGRFLPLMKRRYRIIE
ncbi:GNAT family N-acetyltransferase [Roseivirga sp.]|uniref:GNAT family N-acetyltransferase n=1 Tax=Roseivirga sp. TaxID=1964215 RepID=UPI002B27064E|nr:GNAT family N-acetyltransferase [Roseivirga sp.]